MRELEQWALEWRPINENNVIREHKNVAARLHFMEGALKMRVMCQLVADKQCSKHALKGLVRLEKVGEKITGPEPSAKEDK